MTETPPFRWLQVAPLLQARAAPKCSLLADGRVLVEGGRFWDDRHHRTAHAPSEVYSPTENRWSPATGGERASAPAPRGTRRSGKVVRLAPTCTRLPNGDLLITGGYETTCRMDGEEDDHSMREVEVVEAATGQVHDAGRLPRATHEHGVVVLPSGAVLIIGGKNGDTIGVTDVQLGVPHGLALEALGPELAALARRAFGAEALESSLDEVRRHLAAGRATDALKLATAAAEAAPDDADAWRSVGACLTALRRFADAVPPLSRAVELEPDSAFEWVELADALFFSGEQEKARDAYRRVLALCEQDSTWTWQALRRAREQLQFLDLQAGKSKRVARGPGASGSSLEWNNAGVAAMREGRHAQAKKAFARAVKVDPHNDFAWGNLASVLLSLQRPAEALAAADRAVALCKDDRRLAQGHVSRGIALCELQRFDESLEAYDTSLEFFELPYAWNNRANTLRKLKCDGEALASFEKACALGWHAAHWGRACVLLQRRDLEGARAAVKAALRQDPSLEPKMRADAELAPLWNAAAG